MKRQLIETVKNMKTFPFGKALTVIL